MDDESDDEELGEVNADVEVLSVEMSELLALVPSSFGIFVPPIVSIPIC